MNRTDDGPAARFFCAKANAVMPDDIRANEDITIDEAAAWLHRTGWSAGDLATRTAAGLMWMVFAHRREQRIIGRGDTQHAAWRTALDTARRLPN